VSRTYRFLGGVSLGYASLAIVTIVGLWLTPFLLSRIGTDQLGLWLITTQILGYLMLLDLGVVALAPRETAYATGHAIRGGENKRAATFFLFKSIVKWQVLPTAVMCVAAWWLVAGNWAALRGPLAAILLAFLIVFPFRLYNATLQGLQDLAYIGKVQLAAWSSGTLLTILLVLAGKGLAALAAGWVLTQAITVIACAVRLRLRYADMWTARGTAPTLADGRELFRRSGWVSLSQVGQVFLSGSDLLVLGAFLGPAATVPYSCTSKLISVLANHPQLLMQTAAPALAEMRVSASRARLTEVSIALMRAMLMLSGAVACLVIAANQRFVGWWVGSAQFAGVTLTMLLVIAMLARHLSTTLTYALFSFGHERRLSLTAVCDGLVVVAVTAALAKFTSLGLMSAAFGSLAGVTIVSIPTTAIALARELGITLAALARSLSGWTARFLLAAASCFFMSRFIDIGGIAGLITVGILVALVYGGVMLPLALQPPLGPYVRSAMTSALGFIGMRPAPAVERQA